MIAETKYTRLGNQSIAWQVIGDGPTDFVWNVGRIGSVEGEWADPEATSVLLRIASFCRMIRYDDSLGTGSADPVPLDSLSPLEASVDELMTVMDAAVSERAVLLGGVDNGPAVLLAAASRPERVLGLVLFTAAARVLAAEDYPEGISPEAAEQILDLLGSDEDRRRILSDPGSVAGSGRDGAFVRWPPGRQVAPGRVMLAAATMTNVAINPNFPRPLAYAAVNGPHFALSGLIPALILTAMW